MLVVLQLTGGNDYLNTVIPYNNGLYRDNRKAVGHRRQRHDPRSTRRTPSRKYMAPLKKFWDDDKLAIMHGVGYLDFTAVALPLDGHLAHLRGRQGRHRRLAGSRGARVRSEERERRHLR